MGLPGSVALYFLAAPPLAEIGHLSRGGMAHALTRTCQAPYEWMRDHTPLRLPLIAYGQAWARLPVFEAAWAQVEELTPARGSAEVAEAP